ncbi:MAG TPA: hypothetical protein VN939_06085 [Chthoniobacterales bacterium]|nr:hypothetical protein [Chthoniobacterales bacterium]
MNSWIFFCNSSGDGNGVSAIPQGKRQAGTVQTAGKVMGGPGVALVGRGPGKQGESCVARFLCPHSVMYRSTDAWSYKHDISELSATVSIVKRSSTARVRTLSNGVALFTTAS